MKNFLLLAKIDQRSVLRLSTLFFIIIVWTSDKDNRRVSFGYHDALVHPQSKTDQPVCPRTESDWNDLNDRHSSKPVSRMLDDAYVLKNP